MRKGDAGGGAGALPPARCIRHDTRPTPWTPEAMKIYSWNVNGLRAVLRKGDFQKFLDTHRPDILCLQETKADRAQVEIDLPDYHESWNSASTKGYSGTAIFSRTVPLSVTHDFPKAIAKRFKLTDGEGRDTTDEGRVITAEYPKFFVVSVYTPNAKDDLSRLPLRFKHWDPAFLAHCKALEKQKPVIFCGDLNVAHTELDLANPKPNVGRKGFTVEERAGFQAFIDAGFVDTLRLFKQGNGHYTWWSHFANARARNVGWRIDYVLVSSALQKAVKSAAIHAEVMGSDHCPVSITLKKS
jgi:exodeoxyribonuclease-3